MGRKIRCNKVIARQPLTTIGDSELINMPARAMLHPAGSRAKVSTIRGTRSVQSWPRRENTRIRLPSRRQMKRKPSCLISCTHCGPDGTAWPRVGRQGSTKPAGWRAGEGERQSMGGLHNWRSYRRRVAFQGMIEHPALSIFFLMSAS